MVIDTVKKFKRLFFSAPQVILFGLVNYCNLECPFCELEYTKKKNREKMSDEIFYKGVHDAIELGFEGKISFTHFGEALMHPDFFKFASYAVKKGFPVEFVTNGVLVGKYADEIIKSGISRVKFSIDSVNTSEYEKYRVGAKLDKVISNLETLYKEKKSCGAELSICVQYMVPNKIYESVDISNEDKMDQFKLRLKGKCDSIASNSLTGHEKTVDAKYRIKECRMVSAICTIMHNGNATYCCLDERGELALGNILEKSLREIWFSPKACKERIKTCLGAYINPNFGPKYCRNCFLYPPYSKRLTHNF